jgi:hypothetical protein
MFGSINFLKYGPSCQFRRRTGQVARDLTRSGHPPNSSMQNNICNLKAAGPTTKHALRTPGPTVAVRTLLVQLNIAPMLFECNG